MIEHLVLFKLKLGIGRNDPRVTRVIEDMNKLPGQIPQIRVFEHGFNLTLDAQAWDYGLRAVFEDTVALHAYFDHPVHIPVVQQWEEISDLVFCDFEV